MRAGSAVFAPRRWTRALRLAVLIAAAGGMLFLLLSILFPLPATKPYSFLVLDRNGSYLSAFLADDGIWRLRTPPGEIPERLKRIMVEKEDRFFRWHPGVNPLSLLRALAGNIAAGRRISGGSTITMQIARMLEPKERTYGGKLVEIFRALQLEMRYSKDELLELYLSMIPLGGNIEGLKSASLLYYHTPLERLNIAHLVDLILIPSSPNALRPDRNAGRLYRERLRRGMQWVRAGLLTPEDSLVIVQTDAAADRRTLERKAPHFSLRVRGMHPERPEVRTTLNPAIQSTVEHLLASHLASWKERGVRNGAAIVLANRTMEVLAYAGSPDFGDDAAHGQVDGVQALRSPGSALKPFLYALAMDRGDLTPKSRLLDTPYDLEGFTAENYDGTYSGLVYADEALRRSLNVPMIRLLRATGVRAFVDLLEKGGISSFRRQRGRFGLSMIVGGCGVTLEELTSAYAVFPDGGTYRPPRFLAGDSAVSRERRAVFSPAAAFMVTEILSGLDRPDLPNNFESAVRLPRLAFKTGTSYGRRDAWAIGYTAEFTAGIWLGNADNRGSADLAGGKAAAPLLIDILNAIASPHSGTMLQPPRDIDVRPVCALSGLPPTPLCRQTIMDYYSPSHTNTASCSAEHEYLVSPDTSVSYCPACAGTHPCVTVAMNEYPAELVRFWNTQGLRVAEPPPHNPACTRVWAGDGPRIVSPTDGMLYHTAGAGQPLALRADSPSDVSRHTWYIDDVFFSHLAPMSSMLVMLAPGLHTAACTDDRGRISRVAFEVRNP